MERGFFFYLTLLAVLLTACDGGSLSGYSAPSAPNVPANCGTPPPEPTPIPAFLDYPPSGSVSVSTTIGQIIEKGADAPGEGVTIVISSATGNVPLGTPTAAPSPFPTPFATPPPDFGLTNLPYMAIPLPTLSPSATYAVADVYTGWSNNPPSCTAQFTQSVGTFTTGQ